MNCPSCGAPMRMAGGHDALRCDYCKNIYFSAPDEAGTRYLDEVPELTCPMCAVPLWNATVTGVALRGCKKCRGLLIAMASFEDLVEKLRNERGGGEGTTPEPEDVHARLACPRCHGPMEGHFYYGGGHVAMHDCENCSLNWLAGGALMQIVRATSEMAGS